jgi:hypothetical protein
MSSAVTGVRWEDTVVPKASRVQSRLQDHHVSKRARFFNPVKEGFVATFDVGLVSGLTWAAEFMLDAQANQPQGKHSGELLPRWFTINALAVRLNSHRQSELGEYYAQVGLGLTQIQFAPPLFCLHFVGE